MMVKSMLYRCTFLLYLVLYYMCDSVTTSFQHSK